MLKSIPNTITLFNIVGGCLVILCLLSGQREWVPYFMALSLICDYADGFAARLLKASSPMGKELDSLADMVSFGLVPGVIFYSLLNQTLGIEKLVIGGQLQDMLGLLGFIVTLFAALRLAKFNVDTRQSESFVGLNTPACSIFALGLLMIVETDSYGLAASILSLPLLLAFIFSISFLLIAEIPIFSFKFRAASWKGNEIRILFLLSAILCLVFLKLGVALTLIIALYVLVSLILWLTGHLKLENKDW